MDVTPYLEPRIAPRAVFDQLDLRREQPRFMLPQADGGWTPVTWGEFADQIRQAALYLLERGLEPGDRVCVFAPNRVEWASAALAIQAAGGVIVPIYPNSTADQAGYVIEHSDARFVFVDTTPLLERVFEAWPQCGEVVRVVTLDDGVDAGAALAALGERGVAAPAGDDAGTRVVSWGHAQAVGGAAHTADPERFDRTMDAVQLDQLGMMLYTSGTTGRPKGVPLTHANVAANGVDWLKCNGPLLREDAVDVLWLPMSHIFGFGEVCLGTTLGFTSYMSEPLHALARMREVRPHVFMSVPRFWEKIALQAMGEKTPEAQRVKLLEVTGGRLEFCLSGGAGLKREVKEFLYEHGLLVIEGYGLTEASPTLTLNRPDAFRFDSVGRPLPSVELKLAEDGEILAKGPNVFAGYHKDPAATREVFSEDGWLLTGDIGRFTDDGFLQIVDRKKEILVTASGKNVPPANIELRFANDDLIAHAVVYGDGEPYLVAGVWLFQEALPYVARAAGVDPGDEAAVAAFVEEYVAKRVAEANGGLARHETIKRYAVMERPLSVEGGLLTPTLKVKRKKVWAAFRAEFEALYGRS